MKFIAKQDSGKLLDVTEQVKMIYDALVNSTDWGSEFLDTDEKTAVLAIGVLIGAPTPEMPRDYLYLEKAGFTEPQPESQPYDGNLNNPLFVKWYQDYQSWNERKKLALSKWTREAAAQAAAGLEEVDSV